MELCGQEIAVEWDAVGISYFNQASRMLLLGLNKAIPGNAFIEFQTSVKSLGLLPGDLITVTYPKENLVRTPFRVTKVVPGNASGRRRSRRSFTTTTGIRTRRRESPEGWDARQAVMRDCPLR